MTQLRLRWHGDPPRIGGYLMTPRGRGGYLVLGLKDRGARGGLGSEVFNLLLVDVQRVPRAEAVAGDPCLFQWDRREKRRLPHAG